MPITSLHITNVGPFEDIAFTFDDHINVFTGPNNSGKSTALWVLGDILVYPFDFPKKLLQSEREAIFEAHIPGVSNNSFIGQLPCRIVTQGEQSAENTYWTGERSKKHIAVLETIGYSKFIPALRRSTDYRSPGPTTTKNADTPERAEHKPESSRDVISRQRSLQRRRISEQDPELKRRLALISDNASLVSDEDVIQRIIELDYRSYLQNKPILKQLVTKVGELATAICEDFPVTFMRVDEDDNGFFPKFDTIDGAVPLNTLSQGTQSIIQWLAHLLIGYSEYYDFPDCLESKPGVLIIDEIDAHLHPSWQRRVIPTLSKHFPNLQIFCSTHSPLMLAGLKVGQIQLLQRKENDNVVATSNSEDVEGWTADEILRNFLGVVDPTDLETVGHLERLQYLRGRPKLSPGESKELENLRTTVSQDLLKGPVLSQLERLAEVITDTPPGSSSSSSNATHSARLRGSKGDST